MFEPKSQPLISYCEFLMRIGKQVLFTLVFMAISLLVGMLGYRYLEGFAWIDCFLNTSMLLGGMGEIDTLKTEGGKLFAGFYSLYSGLFMIICGGLLLAPVFHRILHHFHADED